MDTYIATFFSHFGAIRFHKRLQERGVPAKMMPVPRKVSSSCGTCVRFESAETPAPCDDVETLYRIDGDALAEVYTNL